MLSGSLISVAVLGGGLAADAAASRIARRRGRSFARARA
jgi:hypothetical protein